MQQTVFVTRAFVDSLKDMQAMRRVFEERVAPLFKALPNQSYYPPIDIGSGVCDAVINELKRLCAQYGYDASIRFEGSTHLLELTRRAAEHERGAGDDYPNHDSF